MRQKFRCSISVGQSISCCVVQIWLDLNASAYRQLKRMWNVLCIMLRGHQGCYGFCAWIFLEVLKWVYLTGVMMLCCRDGLLAVGFF